MKKHPLPVAAGFLLVMLAACGNEEKKTETLSTPPPPAQSQAPAKSAPKTEVSVGPDGASVKTKDGTKIQVDGKGVEAGDKKVDIKIKTRQ